MGDHWKIQKQSKEFFMNEIIYFLEIINKLIAEYVKSDFNQLQQTFVYTFFKLLNACTNHSINVYNYVLDDEGCQKKNVFHKFKLCYHVIF